jgi:hypothetical protein
MAPRAQSLLVEYRVFFVKADGAASPKVFKLKSVELEAGGSVKLSTRSLFEALGAPAPGLLDPWVAEIHFVIRSHGAIIPGLVSEMISTFNGGCQHPGPGFPEPLPPAAGIPGPNTCTDMQFAEHKP